MSTTISGTFTATAANGTFRAINQAARINRIQLTLVSITGATTATITAYDNNVATATGTAAGATWSAGKAPGYSGCGPGTATIKSEDYQYARYGNQQSQSAPNGAGVVQYMDVNTTTGDLDLSVAPGAKITATISADGTGSFTATDNSNPTGNVVAANTTARSFFVTTLAASGVTTDYPPDPYQVVYGLDFVISAAGMSAASVNYTIVYDPLP